jgi:hypothetical protein
VIHFFTKYKQWLDVIEIELVSREDDMLEFSVYSFSSSVVPASSPLAPLTAALLSFIVFADMGQNELHCSSLRNLLQQDGIEVDVTEDRSAKQIWGRHRVKLAGKGVLADAKS